jgi:DNA-binding NarL/FixJ family response regulator
VRVILADDSTLFREGVARILAERGIEVVAQVATATGLPELVARLTPDVTIVDVRMPPTHTTEGLQAAVELRRMRAGIGVLVLSQHVETAYAIQLLGEDACGVGYLLKDRVDQLDEFVNAVRSVGSGGSVIDPAVVSRLMRRKRENNPLDRLTPRELNVLALVAEGRSNSSIGQSLNVAEKTVQTHVASILMKLDLKPDEDDHRRILAVLAYLRATPNR